MWITNEVYFAIFVTIKGPGQTDLSLQKCIRELNTVCKLYKSRYFSTSRRELTKIFKTIEPQKSIKNRSQENKSYLHSVMLLCLYIAGTKFPLADSPFYNFETIQSEVSIKHAKVILLWVPQKMHFVKIIKPAENHVLVNESFISNKSQ